MSLKRGIFFTLLTQAPTLILFFAASTFMTRILGDEGRGAYTLLNNLVILLSVLLWLNLGAGLTYFTSRSGKAEHDVIGTAATMLLLVLIVLPVILFAIRGSASLNRIFWPGSAEHWGYYGFVVASVFLSILQSTVTAILLGLKQFRILNIMAVSNAVLSASGFLLLFLFIQDRGTVSTLPWVLGAQFAILLLLTLGWCVVYSLYVRIIPRPIMQWEKLKPILFFSGVGYLSIVLNLINYRFDVWVVDKYNGTAALGLYAVAVGLGQLLFNVSEPFSRVVQPFLYGQKREEMMDRYRMIARVNFTVTAALALFIGIVAPIVVPLLFGATFAGSVAALRLLLPGIVFSSATKFLAGLVVQRGYQKFNLYATMVGAIITIVLDLLLIPIWGILGAAIASTLSYLAILIVVLTTIENKIGLSTRDLFFITFSDVQQLRKKLPWRIAE
jgi:O-antigen/teichoic acid export membrane protein